MNPASFPSDVAAAAVPSSPATLSGALAASPSADLTGAPDTLALVLAVIAIALALAAIAGVGILAHRQASADRARRPVRNTHRPPTHILSGSSLEHDDEDDR